MLMNSFMFKQKARQALRGNWQTALLVTFFTGIFTTVANVLQNVTMADIERVMGSISAALSALPQNGDITAQQAGEVMQLYDRLFSAVNSVPAAMWIGLVAVNVLSFVLTPALSVSCCHYFIRRDLGEDPALKDGLLSRMPIWRRSLWLYVRMYVQVFLWGLLFVIPGVIAALRYSMAPFCLAEDPSLTAKQAIAKSKELMKDKKLSYLMLMVSFVWWSLLTTVVQLVLQPMLGVVVTLVAAQFMSLALSTYINASYASFYCAITRPGGTEQLLGAMRERMREMGMTDSDINEAGFGERDEGANGGESEE